MSANVVPSVEDQGPKMTRAVAKGLVPVVEGSMVELVDRIHLEVGRIGAVRTVVDLPAGKHLEGTKDFALGSRRWKPCCFCCCLVKATG